MEFLFEIGLFIAKSFWIVICIVFILMIFGSMVSRRRQHPDVPEGNLLVRHVNSFHKDLQRCVDMESFDPKGMKRAQKAERKERKAEEKKKKQTLKEVAKPKPTDEQSDEVSGDEEKRRHIYVIDFKGDIEASKVSHLRNEITAVLMRTNKPSEVVVRLESAGGYVHSYGLAASQLLRVRESGIKLTVVVDQLAASGGYMMAAVADKIVAAPFALIGSIGVAAEVPNLYRLLQKFDIDYDVLTAGEHKRTMTFFGENKEEHREKLLEEMAETHGLFQDFVSKYRDVVDLPETATGESWYGTRAMELKLVDMIQTSDQYILEACNDAEVYEVRWTMPHRPFTDLTTRLAASASHISNWLKLALRSHA